MVENKYKFSCVFVWQEREEVEWLKTCMSYELDSQFEHGCYTQSSKLCSADVLDVWETPLPVCLGGLPDEQSPFPKKTLWNFHRQAFNSSGVVDLLEQNEKK